MEEQIVYGEQMIAVKLPDNVQTAPQGLSTDLTPAADIEAEIRSALRQPCWLVSATALSSSKTAQTGPI